MFIGQENFWNIFNRLSDFFRQYIIGMNISTLWLVEEKEKKKDKEDRERESEKWLWMERDREIIGNSEEEGK